MRNYKRIPANKFRRVIDKVHKFYPYVKLGRILDTHPATITKWSKYGMPLTKRNILKWEKINKLSTAVSYLCSNKKKILNNKIDPFSIVDYNKCRAADDFIKCDGTAYERTGLCIKHLALLISGEKVTDIFGNKIVVPQQLIEKIEHYPQRCIAATKQGKRCKNVAAKDDILCPHHRYFLNGEGVIRVYTNNNVIKTVTINQIDAIMDSLKETMIKI